mmetsp:Transcript_10496/g.18013  ORF Transcript_10496/g.18013 Transcript_10496/m.18013 type:complete len:238 (+) Transcript_10496:132-845(+)|eukprot:CAMPEP_0198208882 /NCGR_PEP_ID=MMETSP1445-20131203/12219_1 /TAXON_ID=36898 /ORGANISM="Pyramimonas sp., Strain CCMP2087" /LENGTH=237 /DNA_ID=CAMNT_0043882453 /DNA_START=132 /DNA_END=845 /DNA_ORIENTATION=-
MEEEFREGLERTGVRRVLFVNCCNAEGTSSGASHPFDRDDQARVLSKKGKKQAEFSRKWFQALDYKHKAFVVSAARRAADSAQIMAETRHGAGADVSMILVPSLHPLDQCPDAHKMFAQMGYASLQKYLEAGGEGALNNYAYIVMEDLLDCFSRISQGTRGDTLTIFGHAIFLNAVARRVAGSMKVSEEHVNFLEGINLGEGEGLLLETGGPDGPLLRYLHCKNLSVISDHPLYNVL